MTNERWNTFLKREQLLFVGSELERARVWEGSDTAKFNGALERALSLIDLMIQDSRWRANLSMLLGLRGEVARFYIGKGRGSIERIYQAL